MFALVIVLLVPSRVLSKVVQFGVSFLAVVPPQHGGCFFLVSLSSSQKRGPNPKKTHPVTLVRSPGCLDELPGAK